MSVNDRLREYNCSENFYKSNFGFIYTDGVKALCSQFECYWFLDITLSYQSKLKREEFQVWTLMRNENSTAKIVATDGNDKVLITQLIPFTDFKPISATIWVENSVILLPSEH